MKNVTRVINRIVHHQIGDEIFIYIGGSLAYKRNLNTGSSVIFDKHGPFTTNNR